MIVKSKFYVVFFRFCPLLIIFFILGGLYDLKNNDFENLLESNTIIFFGFMVPALTLFNIVMLKNLINKITLEDEIKVSYCYFFTEKIHNINPTDLLKIEFKSGNSDILKFIFRDKEVKLMTTGLKEFEEQWLEPPYNQFMPLNSYSKNAHKIAYNISKKYNIPFESEFIDQ